MPRPRYDVSDDLLREWSFVRPILCLLADKGRTHNQRQLVVHVHELCEHHGSVPRTLEPAEVASAVRTAVRELFESCRTDTSLGPLDVEALWVWKARVVDQRPIDALVGVPLREGDAAPLLRLASVSTVRERLWLADERHKRTIGAHVAYRRLVEAVIDAVSEHASASRPPGLSEDRSAPELSRMRYEELAPILGDCTEGKKALELEFARHPNRKPWWHIASAAWYGMFFAFWSKTSVSVPCATVSFHEAGVRTSRDYVGVPRVDAPRDKALLYEVSNFLSDDDRQIHFFRSNYGLITWVESDWRRFEASNPSTTIFGLGDLEPYPSMITVQSLVQTADGFTLMCMRASDVRYYSNTWAASMGEGVQVSPDANYSPDRTVADTLLRGLDQELLGYGRAVDAVESDSFVAIGREYGQPRGRKVLSGAVLTCVVLRYTLEDVWRAIHHRRRIEDLGENSAWIACRFRSKAAVTTFLARSREGAASSWHHWHNNLDLYELEVHEMSDVPRMKSSPFVWMPTSPMLLFLGAEWLAHRGLVPED